MRTEAVLSAEHGIGRGVVFLTDVADRRVVNVRRAAARANRVVGVSVKIGGAHVSVMCLVKGLPALLTDQHWEPQQTLRP